MTKNTIALGTVVFVCAAASAVCATPTPVPNLTIDARLSTVGAGGLVPSAGTPIRVCQCYNPPTCYDQCHYESTWVTDAAGRLYRPYSGIYSGPGHLFIGAASIDGIEVRGLALTESSSQYNSASLSLIIDPISEAAVQLLSGDDYSLDQLLTLLDRVRQANGATDFSGLTLVDAIEHARVAASADPNVQALLPTWTPTNTPTRTPTATPTPTRTRRPTATPPACLGDCSNDGQVGIDELVTGVNIALGHLPGSVCTTGYPDAPPDVASLVAAVGNALEGCAPPLTQPDLVPISVEQAPGPRCYFEYYGAPMCLTVCVANVGDQAAGPFTVALDGDTTSVERRFYGGLDAGDGECDVLCAAPFEGSVRVDANDEVAESRERNNALPLLLWTPTPPPTCPPPSPT